MQASNRRSILLETSQICTKKLKLDECFSPLKQNKENYSLPTNDTPFICLKEDDNFNKSDLKDDEKMAVSDTEEDSADSTTASENHKNEIKTKSATVNLIDIQKITDVINESKEEEYEVEKILGKKFENGIAYYFIKWKNYSMSDNTWEPIEHLTNSPELVKEFEKLRLNTLDRFQKHANFYPTVKDLEKHMKLLLSKGKTIDNSFEASDDLYKKIERYFAQGAEKNRNLAEKIKDIILRFSLYNSRNEQLDSLAAWKEEINGISKRRPYIDVENDVDLERAPEEFFYINDYLPGSGVVIPDDPFIGCECSSCDSKTKCCFAQCDGYFPYTPTGKIRVSQGTPIYECNKRCACASDCRNRVVQHGSNHQFCIFRTANGRGWGVKTLKSIAKGTFIAEYIGEVITNEEAEKRGKEYDAAGKTYLFDLDYNQGSCPYTVDAAVYGNIAHFINHSCDPNSAVYAVWIDCLDPDLPRLALFATKDIKKNEEITVDYMSQSFSSAPSRKDLLSEKDGAKSLKNKTECKCGTDACRKYLF